MTYVKCKFCNGNGKMELTGVCAETLDLLDATGEASGADLAKAAGCKATAMNQRLSYLENHGLATSRRYGRKRLFKVKGRNEQRA
jgi:DNA-binding transcriptional ArsR family regulator